MGLFFNPPKKEKKLTKKSKGLQWEKDLKIQKQMEELIVSLNLSHINPQRVFCYRTHGSKANANARIWSFPKIFQLALEIEPAYAMEIVSEQFDRLSDDEQKKVIIHELLHIPKNFSGSLLPHRYGHTQIEEEVDVLFEKYRNSIIQK